MKLVEEIKPNRVNCTAVFTNYTSFLDTKQIIPELEDMENMTKLQVVPTFEKVITSKRIQLSSMYVV
jgi:hypothetical protein